LRFLLAEVAMRVFEEDDLLRFRKPLSGAKVAGS
jgi:hypothetical protein